MKLIEPSIWVYGPFKNRKAKGLVYLNYQYKLEGGTCERSRFGYFQAVLGDNDKFHFKEINKSELKFKRYY